MGNEDRTGPLEGLTKVSGNSFEEVVALLKKAEIKFRAHPPTRSLVYFRTSSIAFDRSKHDQVLDMLGRPDRKCLTVHSYYTKYDVGAGFDMKTLHGPILFDDGMLVERVELEGVSGYEL